jgi:hypothetical protein
VKTDERVKDEQAWTEGFDGVDEADAVLLQVEAYGDGGDDVDVELREADAGGATDPLETAAGRRAGRLRQRRGGRAPLVGDGEVAQARGARGDGDGQVEGEKGLAALGLTAHDADGLGGPQVADEPALLLGDCLEVSRAAGGKR